MIRGRTSPVLGFGPAGFLLTRLDRSNSNSDKYIIITMNCKYVAGESGLMLTFGVTTHLENLEKLGNSKVVREKSGKMEKVRVTLKSASLCS